MDFSSGLKGNKNLLSALTFKFNDRKSNNNKLVQYRLRLYSLSETYQSHLLISWWLQITITINVVSKLLMLTLQHPHLLDLKALKFQNIVQLFGKPNPAK